MLGRKGPPLALTALIALLGWGLHQTNLMLEGRIQQRGQPGELGPLPDGKVLRVLSLGFDRLVADLFWLRTIYYVGDPEVAKVGYPEAARLAELVTDIDPGFRTVYSAMNGVLTVLRHDPDAAIALLEKGIRHIRWWKLHFLLGFNYFWDRGEWRRAAEQMEIAAELGGPPHLSLLAARLYTRGGEPETAMAFVAARLRELEPGDERERLSKRFAELWVLRDLRAIDAAIGRFRETRGTPPDGIADLLEAGLLPSEPRDPHGEAYWIEAGRARAKMDVEELSRVYINR
ncbi:MAG: hypothetical protein ACE5FG_01445 [Myxococcota bacterium]